jgi:cysteine synthase A
MIVNHIYDLIGETPVINISDLFPDIRSSIYLKLEWFNPGGSVKDRIAKQMILDAESDGKLNKGQTIIEPTSGNTGIGLAMIAASKGYPCIIVMPKSVSIERIKILEGYGAEVVLLDSMTDCIKYSEEQVKKYDYFCPMQFDNTSNPKAHILSTGPEIIKDFPNLDFFITSAGTGGSITGIGSYLKTHSPNTKIIVVEPETSQVLNGGKAGDHTIQGIGPGFIPSIVDHSVIDEYMTVNDEKAYDMARFLAKKGLFVGISTGANVLAAYNLSKTLPEGQSILTLSPSNAERYLSTKLFKK